MTNKYLIIEMKTKKATNELCDKLDNAEIRASVTKSDVNDNTYVISFHLNGYISLYNALMKS